MILVELPQSNSQVNIGPYKSCHVIHRPPGISKLFEIRGLPPEPVETPTTRKHATLNAAAEPGGDLPPGRAVSISNRISLRVFQLPTRGTSAAARRRPPIRAQCLQRLSTTYGTGATSDLGY